MRPLGWALVQSDQHPQRKRKLGHKEKYQGWTCTEVRPCECPGRRRPSTSQGQGPRKKPNLPTPCSWRLSLQICEKINLCCLSHPVCGIVMLTLINWHKYIYHPTHWLFHMEGHMLLLSPTCPTSQQIPQWMCWKCTKLRFLRLGTI